MASMINRRELILASSAALLVPALAHFLLDLLELRLHSITPGFPLNLEFAFA